MRKNDFVIKGIDWLPYIVGWMTGIWSPIFWIIMLALNQIKDGDLEQFFNDNFHKRVVVWGWVMIALIIIGALFNIGSP